MAGLLDDGHMALSDGRRLETLFDYEAEKSTLPLALALFLARSFYVSLLISLSPSLSISLASSL